MSTSVDLTSEEEVEYLHKPPVLEISSDEEDYQHLARNIAIMHAQTGPYRACSKKAAPQKMPRLLPTPRGASIGLASPPPKNAAPKRDSLAKCWLYTVNNYETRDHIPDSDCKYRIQGYEVGEKGTPHIQGYVWLNKEIRFSAFKKLYPTISNFRKADGSPYQNFFYCKKDGDFEEFGPRPAKPKAKDTTYSEALDAPTVRDGIRIIKEKRPRDFCLHGEAIERNLKNARRSNYVHAYAMEDFSIGPQPLTKSVLICGPSNTGKTHYACAYFVNPLVVSHMDTLRSLSPDHDGIVFDDMSFMHHPPEAVIHLLDQEFDRQIHVRYNTAHIPKGTRKIFTHNISNPFYKEDIDDSQKNAIERRIHRVNIINKIF